MAIGPGRIIPDRHPGLSSRTSGGLSFKLLVSAIVAVVLLFSTLVLFDNSFSHTANLTPIHVSFLCFHRFLPVCV